MNNSPIFQKLTSARTALSSTVQKILDLNRQLKSGKKDGRIPDPQDIRQELKLLNKVADQQATIVKMYEVDLRKASN